MESRGRRGSGTRLTRIDGLITFGIVQLFMNIWRQWYVADLWKIWLNRFSKSNESFRSIQYLNDFCLRSIFDFYLGGYAYAFSADQTLPGQVIFAVQKKQFNASAGGLARINPRGNDARLIQNQQIIGMKIFADLTKDFVFQRTHIAMKNKQARRITRLDGRLRDGRFGEMIVKVRGLQSYNLLVLTGLITCPYPTTWPPSLIVNVVPGISLSDTT